METRIFDIERAAAMHWRGTEEEWLGGWLLRAAEGFTGRANSALPLRDPELPLDDALAAVTEWYRTRGLPPMISVPMPLGQTSELDEYLARRSWKTRPGPAVVMTADLADVPAPPDVGLRVTDGPDAEWLRMHRYRGQSDLPPVRMKVLMSARSQAFVSVRDDGKAIAVGRLSVSDGWAGITSVEVDPACRRRGLGTAITLGICAEAVTRGADQVFLQVEAENSPAKSLYERCGFTYSHRYHYRLAPE
ncbi:MAG TPA: GNAT family N-acetyltransferase [Trebonia sp.]